MASAIVLLVTGILFYYGKKEFSDSDRQVRETFGSDIYSEFARLLFGIAASGILALSGLIIIAAIVTAAVALGLVFLIERTPYVWAWFHDRIPIQIQPYILTAFVAGFGFGLHKFREHHRFWYGILETYFAIARPGSRLASPKPLKRRVAWRAVRA